MFRVTNHCEKQILRSAYPRLVSVAPSCSAQDDKALLMTATLARLRVLPDFPAAPLVHQLLEHAAAVLVAFELVEAGAGGRQQHNFAGMGGGGDGADGLVERFAGVDGDDAAQLRLDFGGG